MTAGEAATHFYRSAHADPDSTWNTFFAILANRNRPKSPEHIGTVGNNDTQPTTINTSKRLSMWDWQEMHDAIQRSLQRRAGIRIDQYRDRFAECVQEVRISKRYPGRRIVQRGVLSFLESIGYRPPETEQPTQPKPASKEKSRKATAKKQGAASDSLARSRLCKTVVDDVMRASVREQDEEDSS